MPTEKLDLFFPGDTGSARNRWLLAGVCLLVFGLAHLIVNPAWGAWLRPLFVRMRPGPRLFLHHLLVYSLGRTLVCVFFWWLLVRWNRFRPPCFQRKIKISLLQGAIAGVVIAVLPLMIYLPRGYVPVLKISGWAFMGNLFSNAWEEVVFRGFVFAALLLALRRPMPAALISGLIFGLSHMQYHPLQQIYVGMIGAYLALLYYHTGNLLGPWIAHQISDALLDSLHVL